MTTTANNNENKVIVNRIGFSGLFSKFFKEDTQVYDYLFEGGKCYSFAYYIGLNDDCKNELCFNWLDHAKKVPSDLINDLICANVLPEGIDIVNKDKGIE